jgi:hypothetical protein
MRGPSSRQISEPIDETLDARTRTGRRHETLVKELGAKYGAGGPKSLAAKLRVRSAAALIVRLESAQADAAAGNPFEPSALAELTMLTAKAIADASPPTGLEIDPRDRKRARARRGAHLLQLPSTAPTRAHRPGRGDRHDNGGLGNRSHNPSFNLWMANLDARKMCDGPHGCVDCN